jgi:hypothetical protein
MDMNAVCGVYDLLSDVVLGHQLFNLTPRRKGAKNAKPATVDSTGRLTDDFGVESKRP